jgi:methionine aminopeptidase, type I
MIKLKTEEEIELLRENALLVSKTLAEVGKHVAPGVTTLELNKIAETFIRDHGAVPAFLGYNGFPYALCMSVNDVVVHGFASDYHLQEGDIVSVDCGTILKGFYGDSAYTFPVGKVSEETAKLLEVTKESLYRGISMAVAGNRIGDISNAIQTYIESFGFSAVREMVGHGIGKRLHESPDVPNYGRKGDGKNWLKVWLFV